MTAAEELAAAAREYEAAKSWPGPEPVREETDDRAHPDGD